MEHLEQDIQEIKQSLADQAQVLSRLSNALTGDEEFGTKGIAQIAKDNSEYIEKDKIRKAKMTGVAGVISVLVTTATTLVLKIFFKD